MYYQIRNSWKAHRTRAAGIALVILVAGGVPAATEARLQPQPGRVSNGTRDVVTSAMPVQPTALPGDDTQTGARSIIYVDTAATGANNGTSWEDAFNDLQNALYLAIPHTQIWVADGTYWPSARANPFDPRSVTFQLINDIMIYGGFAGGEATLAERNPAANITILSGDLYDNDHSGGDNSENAYHVVTGINSAPTAILDGFAIIAGNANGVLPDMLGGGFVSIKGNPTIVNCRFLGNSALFGGGMANSFGNPTLTSCVFSGNTATIAGGGMFNDDFSRPTLNHCTFSLNQTDGDGGGIKNGLSGVNSPRLKNCILWGNIADADGDSGGPYFNGDAQIHSETAESGIPVAHFSCIQDLLGAIVVGGGNIGEDPKFVDADGDDDEPGTLDDNLELDRFSPCTDAGDSTAVPDDVTDVDGDDDTTERLPLDLAWKDRFINDGEVPDSGRGAPPVVDMGAYEHEPDCNENGIPDFDDIWVTSDDCNYNEVPDECEIDETSPGGPFFCPAGSDICDPDCNENGIPDVCDPPDCNENGVPDECDLADCPCDPVCEPWCDDCNGNGQIDECDITYCGGSPDCDDCNDNGRPDWCDIEDETSLDEEEPYGVPDECIEPLSSGHWTDDIWGLGGTYPDNDGGVPGLHVTLEGAAIVVDEMIEVESLRLDYGTMLNVDWPDPGLGDFSVGTGNIRSRGNIRVEDHTVTAGGMQLGDEGALKVAENAVIDLTGGRLTVGYGAIFEADDPLAPVVATLTADHIEILPTFPGAESQVTLIDEMTVMTAGDFVMDGTDVQIFWTGANTASTRGGKTPPILKTGPHQSSRSAEGRSNGRALVNTPLSVGGDFRILNAAKVCAGCDAEPCFCHDCYPEQCDRYTQTRVEGRFDNQSRYSSLFDWANGGLVLAGGTEEDPLTFEVAGIDLGKILEGFETSEDTNAESFAGGETHTNFAMGLIEVAPDSYVTFKNDYVNTVGSAGCAEALYVRVLKLGANSTITLDNCNVYYEMLEEGVDANIVESGCGGLQEVCDFTPGPRDVCLTHILVAHDGLNDFSNLCATPDGPTPVMCEGGPTEFGSDAWYAYTATCDGLLTVDLCENEGFDGLLALYTDETNTCQCPADASTQWGPCDDDGCGETNGPPTITTFAQEGTCYTIRIGGRAPVGQPEEGAQGEGQFEITCEPSTCTKASPPVLDPRVPDTGNGTRNRYLSFSAGDAGRSQAVRVRLTSLPPPYDYANGRTMWVKGPFPVSELPGDPGPSPPTFLAAELGCQGDAHYADWTTYGVVHVYDVSLIPSAMYDVQVIDESCGLDLEIAYSDPLEINTSLWGDVVSDCPGIPCGPPNGVANFDDISSLVDKFRNLPGAPQKSRADIAGDPPLGIPDQLGNFVDISYCVDAFRGLPYPFEGPPVTDPCP
ncbi:MAG: right-handed parallel beta-helix repeat-containing protein [Phycisphaerae bacterium]